jgi:HSP20 family protein
MANLTVREHLVSDLLDLKQEFERAFHHIFKHHAYPAGSAETFFAVVPPIESWVDTEDKQFHLTMAVPGMKPEALNVILQGKNLTFSGEQKQEEEKKEKGYFQREFSYGRFARTVTLPDGVDGEKLTAVLKDGILEITAPIAAEALPKKIQVNKAAPAAAKEGGK